MRSDQQARRPQFFNELNGLAPGCQVSCGYRRCLDFDPSDARGQDFFAVSCEPEHIVGVVADGVGQSFFGDLAAREVGDWLVDFLWQQRGTGLAIRDFQARLETGLLVLQQRVDGLVREEKPNAPPDSLLGRALSKTRLKGSQTVFTAFSIDVARYTARVVQVGDVLTWLYTAKGNFHRIVAIPDGRWSSAGRSCLRMSCYETGKIAGLVIHSDGLREEWVPALRLPEVSEKAFLREVAARAAIDDLAYVAVRLPDARGRASHVPLPESAPPQPPATAPASPERAAAPVTSAQSVSPLPPPLPDSTQASMTAGASLRSSPLSPESSSSQPARWSPAVMAVKPWRMSNVVLAFVAGFMIGALIGAALCHFTTTHGR